MVPVHGEAQYYILDFVQCSALYRFHRPPAELWPNVAPNRACPRDALCFLSIPFCPRTGLGSPLAQRSDSIFAVSSKSPVACRFLINQES